jgi:hypothetical protein
MVSVWAAENRLVFGQAKTEEKSNEITALPTLLEKPALEGSIVTMDAMGCQYKTAGQVVEKKADYLFSLKKNLDLPSICVYLGIGCSGRNRAGTLCRLESTQAEGSRWNV